MKIIKYILLFLTPFAMAYICGAFGFADFNMVNWEPVNRGFLSFLATAAGIVAILAALEYDKQN